MTAVLMEKLVVCGKEIDPNFAFKRAKSSQSHNEHRQHRRLYLADVL